MAYTAANTPSPTASQITRFQRKTPSSGTRSTFFCAGLQYLVTTPSAVPPKGSRRAAVRSFSRSCMSVPASRYPNTITTPPM